MNDPNWAEQWTAFGTVGAAIGTIGLTLLTWFQLREKKLEQLSVKIEGSISTKPLYAGPEIADIIVLTLENVGQLVITIEEIFWRLGKEDFPALRALTDSDDPKRDHNLWVSFTPRELQPNNKIEIQFFLDDLGECTRTELLSKRLWICVRTKRHNLKLVPVDKELIRNLRYPPIL